MQDAWWFRSMGGMTDIASLKAELSAVIIPCTELA